MTDFYVLNDVPAVVADSGEEAARRYAGQNGITSGSVLIAKGVRSFDITTDPAKINVQPSPE